MRLLCFIAVLALLAGCAASSRQQVSADGTEALVNKARGPEENRKLHTDLIREMIKQDRLYAALAHLQAQQNKFGGDLQLKLLRAEILRKLDRTDAAEKQYKALLGTRYAGYAQHGLGLIYARHDLALGTKYLQRAAKKLPTDARLRNDLGFALMKQGKLDKAQVQLATAFQLDDNADLARNNYIVVLLLQGNERAARKVAANNHIDAKTMAELRQRAKNLQSVAAAAVPAANPATPAGTQPVVGSGGG